MKKNYINCLCTLTLSLLIIACGDKETTLPVAGEYGQTLVSSRGLSAEEIEKLNNLQSDSKPLTSINFEGNPHNNPFRFVVVVRGVAERNGEVDVRFIASQQTKKGESAPSLMREEDDTMHERKNKVLLVLPSEPFSLDASSGSHMRSVSAQARLSKRKNIIIENVELQIWQGKGTHTTSFRFAWLMVVVLSVFAFVVRLISAKWRM